MRSSIAALVLVAAGASLALTGCTKTKIKDSTVDNPGPVTQREVIVTPPASGNTTTTTTTRETTVTPR
jgi:hypothetical protein